MKPLLLLFFLFLELGSGAVWPLPQESDAALHHLCQSIIKARQKVLIVTLQIEGYPLKEALRKAAAKGTQIELFVTQPSSISPLTLFSTVSLHTTTQTLSDTIICIDTTIVCTLPAPLSKTAFNTTTGVLTCKQTIQNCLIDERLLRSHPYLEE